MNMAGAVTALGDTLFPVDSLAQGIQADFSSTAHFLVRLRVWHPVFATVVGLYFFYLVRHLLDQNTGRMVRRFSLALLIIYGVQLVVGALNLILLVPVWMQLIHLFLATMVWISLTMLSAAFLAENEVPQDLGGAQS